MKIGIVRQEKAAEVCSFCSMGTFLERVKKGSKEKYISQLRERLPSLQGSNDRFIHLDKIPRIYPVAEFRRTPERCWKFKRYNGIVLVEVNRLSGLAEAEYVKSKAALLPQTFAALVGSSGRSVKIWVRFSLPDGTLPETEEPAALFHAQAYRIAVQCYQPLLPFPITLKEPSLRQSFRMTVDKKPYYHADAAAFCLEQPVNLADGTSFREQKLAEKNPLARMEPTYDSYHTLTVMFQAALKRAYGTLENWRRGNELVPVLAPLAEECFKSGIPEEEAVYRTLRHFPSHKDEPGLRATFHNVYSEMKGFGKRPAITHEQDTALRLEEFLKRRYEIRFNSMTDDLEYRERNSTRFCFSTLDKRARNSIAINALKEGIQAWDRDIDRFLHSDYIPVYNPVEEYLFELGEWDGHDRIRELADRVACRHPHWRDLFYRWFLSMVAHWLGRDKQHGNATTPVLIPQVHLLPYPVASRTSLRLYGQLGFQQQARRRTVFGALLPGELRRVRPDQQQPTSIPETLVAEAVGKPTQALQPEHSRNPPICFIHRYKQPQGLAVRPIRKPALHLRGDNDPYRHERYHQLQPALCTSLSCRDARRTILAGRC